MSEVRLLALGVGDAFSARHYSSCFALEADGRWLLVDCPHPIRKILHEAGAAAGVPLDVDLLEGVVLTHLHSDHASGVAGLGFYGRYVLGRRVPLVVHPAVAADLWDRTLAGGMEWSLPPGGAPPVRHTLDDYFDVRLLDDAAPLDLRPFRLRARPTVHSVPTFALFIQAAGRAVGYSADTAFDPGLIDWLGGADLIVHEASGGPLHTPYAALAALPAAVREKMRLIHYPDDFDPAASIIEPLRQGNFYPVGRA